MRPQERPQARAAAARRRPGPRRSSSWKSRSVPRRGALALRVAASAAAVALRLARASRRLTRRTHLRAATAPGRSRRPPRARTSPTAPRRTRRRARRRATSSSCVPCSMMRPSSSTTMRSQREAAATRCVISTTVRAAAWRSMASRIAASVFASTADSGSSSTSTLGSRTSARASAMRCFWPPESCTPRSPTTVSNCSGSAERLLEHLRLARRRRGCAPRPPRDSHSSSAEADVARHRGREQEGVLLGVADRLAHGAPAADRRRPCRRANTAPAGVGSRRASSMASVDLPEPVRPTIASDARRHVEGDVVEHLARRRTRRRAPAREMAPRDRRRARAAGRR